MNTGAGSALARGARRASARARIATKAVPPRRFPAARAQRSNFHILYQPGEAPHRAKQKRAELMESDRPRALTRPSYANQNRGLQLARNDNNDRASAIAFRSFAASLRIKAQSHNATVAPVAG